VWRTLSPVLLDNYLPNVLIRFFVATTRSSRHYAATFVRLSVSSPNLRKVLGILTNTADTDACCCYRRLSYGEQKMSLETHFFPFWERTKNVLRGTNDINIDSLMGTKKIVCCFETHVNSQSGVIVDAKVSDRQRRCRAPCRNIIGCKNSFTCHVVLGFCLLSCWVQFKVRSLSF